MYALLFLQVVVDSKAIPKLVPLLGHPENRVVVSVTCSGIYHACVWKGVWYVLPHVFRSHVLGRVYGMYCPMSLGHMC